MINHALGNRRNRDGTKRTVKRILTVDEMLRLIEAAGSEAFVGGWDRDRRTLQKILFMLGTGAAPGEMLGVQNYDIDFPNNRVFLSGEAPGARKTEYRPRWVYPPDFFWNRLGAFPREGDAFLAPTGKPYTARKYRGGQFRVAFASVAQAAGIDSSFTPYDLRHAWASFFYAATRNVKALTILGGWRDGDMPLSTYVKFTAPWTAKELLDASIDCGQVLDNLNWDNM